MPIDFNALGGTTTTDTVTSPREIFSLLPSKAHKYQYLRDVQAEVLFQWYNRRNEKDCVLKMNTGSGKTVVGLLALKSCLNEGLGPAVYIAPTPYLLRQVREEAKELGIETTEDVASSRFLRGKAILLINIYKLINGKSAFGIGDDGVKIPIGSIVIDDAHACLSISEDQFALTLPGSHEAYGKLRLLFEADLKKQSPSTTLEIMDGDPGRYLLVPYWAWNDKLANVLKILHAYRNDDALKFTWPLLVENLNLCRCVIGGDGAEITPPCLPIHTIPSFVNAKRRLYMTSAFSDDSILVSDFDAAPQSIQQPITPDSAGDIGDRMILVPQEINPTITDEQLKEFYKTLSRRYNVIVLVPSDYRAQFWSDVADRKLTTQNIASGVEELICPHYECHNEC